jgi:hypothetical protein
MSYNINIKVDTEEIYLDGVDRITVVWDRVNFRTVVGVEMKLWGP